MGQPARSPTDAPTLPAIKRAYTGHQTHAGGGSRVRIPGKDNPPDRTASRVSRRHLNPDKARPGSYIADLLLDGGKLLEAYCQAILNYDGRICD